MTIETKIAQSATEAVEILNSLNFRQVSFEFYGENYSDDYKTAYRHFDGIDAKGNGTCFALIEIVINGKLETVRFINTYRETAVDIKIGNANYTVDDKGAVELIDEPEMKNQTTNAVSTPATTIKVDEEFKVGTVYEDFTCGKGYTSYKVTARTAKFVTVANLTDGTEKRCKIDFEQKKYYANGYHTVEFISPDKKANGFSASDIDHKAMQQIKAALVEDIANEYAVSPEAQDAAVDAEVEQAAVTVAENEIDGYDETAFDLLPIITDEEEELREYLYDFDEKQEVLADKYEVNAPAKLADTNKISEEPEIDEDEVAEKFYRETESTYRKMQSKAYRAHKFLYDHVFDIYDFDYALKVRNQRGELKVNPNKFHLVDTRFDVEVDRNELDYVIYYGGTELARYRKIESVNNAVDKFAIAIANHDEEFTFPAEVADTHAETESEEDFETYPIDIAIYFGDSKLTEIEIEEYAIQFRLAIGEDGNFGKAGIVESYLSVYGDTGGDNKTIWKLIGDLCWRGDCVLKGYGSKETDYELREMPGEEIDALLARMGIDNDPPAFEIPELAGLKERLDKEKSFTECARDKLKLGQVWMRAASKKSDSADFYAEQITTTDATIKELNERITELTAQITAVEAELDTVNKKNRHHEKGGVEERLR